MVVVERNGGAWEKSWVLEKSGEPVVFGRSGGVGMRGHYFVLLRRESSVDNQHQL